MNKQASVSKEVAKTVELFESVAKGCEIIVEQAARTPALVDVYQPLLPVLKRLQSLVGKAITTLDRQAAAGREG